MKKAFILISNDRHHLELMLPIAHELNKKGFKVEFLSISNFRGLELDLSELRGFKVRMIPPFRVKRNGKAGAGNVSSTSSSWKSVLVYKILWQLVIRPFLSLTGRVDVFITPNDIAFPFNKILERFKHKNCRTYLVQEGIRFPVPSRKVGPFYGQGGADKVFCWGEFSKDYFLDLQVNPQKIVISGCSKNAYSDLIASPSVNVNSKKILIASNPIDDQGFCTSCEKNNLLRKLLNAFQPIMDADVQVELQVCIHHRESSEMVKELINNSAFSDRIKFEPERRLYQLFPEVNSVIVFASTVGLEALLAGKHLGVIKIYDHDFAFNYVQKKVGYPMDLSGDAEGNARLIEDFISFELNETLRASYLEKSLAANLIPEEAIVKAIAG